VRGVDYLLAAHYFLGCFRYKFWLSGVFLDLLQQTRLHRAAALYEISSNGATWKIKYFRYIRYIAGTTIVFYSIKDSGAGMNFTRPLIAAFFKGITYLAIPVAWQYQRFVAFFSHF